MPDQTPTILIIVGISGDLAKRKLLPAIGQLAAVGVLPPKLKIIGITRQPDVNPADLIKGATNEAYLADNLSIFQMDLAAADDYTRLNNRITELEAAFGYAAQRLYYLSVPPQVSYPIIELLGTSGLASAPNTKLLLEKPFGVDLASARELIEHINHHFKPDQVYRIDHYLAKEMAQNLIVFREGNSLFKRAWNKDFIESITVTASEKIGIEGRAGFYESTGALRDLVQSHLLQLTALTLMETPQAGHLDEVPARRLAALRQLKLANEQVLQAARRGQYDTYADEAKNPGSVVETFVDLSLQSSDPRWSGVTIRLVTGKALAEKTTEIRIAYKKDQDYESNELILRLQPDEGIELCLWTKAPGYERKLERHALKFRYEDHFDELPEAYERVFLDAINSNHTLFATSEEVLETWRILAPVQAAWDNIGGDELIKYRTGTPAADVLKSHPSQ